MADPIWTQPRLKTRIHPRFLLEGTRQQEFLLRSLDELLEKPKELVSAQQLWLQRLRLISRPPG
jgi:hypothetical protein